MPLTRMSVSHPHTEPVLILLPPSEKKSPNAGTAIEVYTGVLYAALGWASLSKEARMLAQSSIIIISAKYGALHPLDPIEPYKEKIVNKDMSKAISNFAPAQWYGLLYLSFLCGLFSFLANLWAIRRTSASRAGLLLATEPIWAVVVGVTVGGETLATLGVIGAILILGSTFWGQRIETRHREKGLAVNL